MHKYLLVSFLACLGWPGLASAQFGLGIPVKSESSSESRPNANYPVLGFIARGALTPIRAAAGYLMPPRHEVIPSRADVARMIMDGGYSPAEISAAKIRIDETQAVARRAAVKYLATIDCLYCPEVASGLIAALRSDRAEMVRHEAALGLGNCRVLTDRMLEALNLAALGGDLDGNPPESSERVRLAARSTLDRCVCRGLCLPPIGSLEMLPAAAWLSPEHPKVTIQPAFYPMPIYASLAPPILQGERRHAETVSTNLRSDSSATPQRSFYRFVLNLTSPRDSTRPTGKAIDPRLQGLTPLGSEVQLAIPMMSPLPGE